MSSEFGASVYALEDWDLSYQDYRVILQGVIGEQINSLALDDDNLETLELISHQSGSRSCAAFLVKL